jgi:hypothetical protein
MAGPEPVIDGLILREDSNVIVTVWQGAVSGEIAVHHLETTGTIAVSWLDPDSTEFSLDPQIFELQSEIADPLIASYQQIGDWSFTVTGLTEGATDLVLKVWHIPEQHYDFISPPIPIHVIDLAVGLPDPDQQAAWGRARLWPAHPNPFNPSTLIRYELARETDVDLSVYDLEGRLVTRLESGLQSVGEHAIQWHAERFASGAYFVQLKTPQEVRVEKIVLAK